MKHYKKVIEVAGRVAVSNPKEFVDPRAVEKERRLREAAKATKKALKTNKRQVKSALDKHRLGWTTVDGKDL